MKGLQTVLFTGLLMPTMTACSWFGGYLPIQVTDDRPAGAKPAVVDVFAVPTALERERAAATPVDEYFSTVGLPSRPQQVWRAALPASEDCLLLKGDPDYKLWRQGDIEVLTAVTPEPRRTVENGPETRRVFFSPRRADYPAGTRSLHLRLTAEGLQLEPSPRKLKRQPHP